MHCFHFHSYHAGDNSCDADDSDDGVPMRASTPIKIIPGHLVNSDRNLHNVSGYTADDSSTGIGLLTDYEDSENEDTEPNSESKSESTVISMSRGVDPKSVESSTDTLVADAALVSDATDSKTIRGDHRVLKTDVNRVCASYSVGQGGKTDSVNNANTGLPDNSTIAKRRLEAVDPTSNATAPDEVFGPPKTKATTMASEIITTDVDIGLPPPAEPTLPVQCEVCATSRRLLGDIALSSSVHGTMNSSNNNITTSTSVISPSNGIITAGNGVASKVSSYNTPMHSRTPSSGLPASPDESGVQVRIDRQLQDATLGASCSVTRSAFDVDGLSPLHDEVQNRLNTVISGYKVCAISLFGTFPESESCRRNIFMLVFITCMYFLYIAV